jgi:hypothetical protein
MKWNGSVGEKMKDKLENPSFPSPAQKRTSVITTESFGSPGPQFYLQ